MSDLEAILPHSKPSPKGERPFKKIICLSKTEESISSGQGMTRVVRYRYEFGTLKNDLGFGASTGDLIQSVIIMSMDKDRFKVGEKYHVQFQLDA